MQQLSKSIGDQAVHYMPTTEDVAAEPREVQEMQEAAILWAKVSLRTFRDELLTKALAISAAMSNFTAELKQSK